MKIEVDLVPVGSVSHIWMEPGLMGLAMALLLTYVARRNQAANGCLVCSGVIALALCLLNYILLPAGVKDTDWREAWLWGQNSGLVWSGLGLFIGSCLGRLLAGPVSPEVSQGDATGLNISA